MTINRTVLQFCMHYKADIHVHRVIRSVILTLNLTTIACNPYFLGGLMYILVSVKGPVLRGRRNFVSLDLIDCIPSNISACIVSSNGMILFSCIPLHTCAYFSLQGWINGLGEISLPSSFDNCFFNSFASPVSGTRCSECVSRVFHRNVSTSGPTSTAIRQRVTSPRRILYSI